MLVTGSGDVFTASRSPPFVRWDSSAVTLAVLAANACSSDPASPAMSTPRIAAIVGRMTVWMLSQMLSTYGILSATNSSASRMPTKTRTSVRCNAAGVSATPARPSSPAISKRRVRTDPGRPAVRDGERKDVHGEENLPIAAHQEPRCTTSSTGRCPRRSDGDRRSGAG